MSFWFDRYPLPFFELALWVALAVLVLATACGAWFKWQANKKGLEKLAKTVWQKLGNLFLSLGLVGLIFLFFKQQRLPYLGMRIWLGLWLVACAIWLGFIVKYIIVDLPKAKEEKKMKDELLKYIP